MVASAGFSRAAIGFSPFSAHTRRARQTARAVTLFELIVVFLVTAVLAALLILSTQYLITRAKISRVKEEQRVLSRALENYRLDYGSYPPEIRGLSALVAPTAYLTSVPRDPFLPASQPYTYVALDESEHVWALVSAGPNGRLDILEPPAAAAEPSGGPSGGASATGARRTPTGRAALVISEADAQAFLARFSYDPTNGASSDGDLVTLLVGF